MPSCETIDIPPLSSNVSIHEGTDHEDVQAKASPVMSTSIDEKGDSAIRIAEESGKSTTVVSSELGTVPGPVIESEKQQSCDASSQALCETIDNCLKFAEASTTEKVSKPQKTLDDNGVAKEMDISPVLHEPTAIKHDEGNPSLKNSGDLKFWLPTFEILFHILCILLWFICYF